MPLYNILSRSFLRLMWEQNKAALLFGRINNYVLKEHQEEFV